jgi:hypothetical protein
MYKRRHVRTKEQRSFWRKVLAINPRISLENRDNTPNVASSPPWSQISTGILMRWNNNRGILWWKKISLLKVSEGGLKIGRENRVISLVSSLTLTSYSLTISSLYPYFTSLSTLQLLFHFTVSYPRRAFCASCTFLTVPDSLSCSGKRLIRGPSSSYSSNMINHCDKDVHYITARDGCSRYVWYSFSISPRLPPFCKQIDVRSLRSQHCGLG